MTVDPTDPETFETTENGEASVALDEETPEADAAEQHRELQQHGDDPLTRVDPAVANPADAAEQTRVVDQDEDDYR
ncbi:hypothetical protein [Streptomyces ficellus]|uniref:DUF5709 domain-containing protein n=1 Tax=Streptomyces ficellus TaxID=1977088 RepID=A0A6I6FI12_9ACTN|nr:hypothetical protein [Streptomyces ficellus]QGV78705.1 hypothetical protein EIZ62_10960 [Streptomyces ficellus]